MRKNGAIWVCLALTLAGGLVAGCGRPEGEEEVSEEMSLNGAGDALPFAFSLAPGRADQPGTPVKEPESWKRHGYRVTGGTVLFDRVVQLEWMREPDSPPGSEKIPLRKLRRLRTVFLMIEPDSGRELDQVFYTHRRFDVSNRSSTQAERLPARRDMDTGLFYVPLEGLWDDPSKIDPAVTHEFMLEVSPRGEGALEPLMLQLRFHAPEAPVRRQELVGVGTAVMGFQALRGKLHEGEVPLLTERLTNPGNTILRLRLEGAQNLVADQVAGLPLQEVAERRHGTPPILRVNWRAFFARAAFSEIRIRVRDEREEIVSQAGKVDVLLAPGESVDVSWSAVREATHASSCLPMPIPQMFSWQKCTERASGSIRCESCTRTVCEDRLLGVVARPAPAGVTIRGTWIRRYVGMELQGGEALRLSEAEEFEGPAGSGGGLFAGGGLPAALPVEGAEVPCQGLF